MSASSARCCSGTGSNCSSAATWVVPRDSGINEVDSALRREVRAVDDLDRAVLAALGGLTLTDEIESMRADKFHTFHGRPTASSCWMFCSGWRFSTDPPRMPSTRAAWAVRQPGLTRFASWLVHQCDDSGPNGRLPERTGHRTKRAEYRQRSTVSALVTGPSAGVLDMRF